MAALSIVQFQSSTVLVTRVLEYPVRRVSKNRGLQSGLGTENEMLP